MARGNFKAPGAWKRWLREGGWREMVERREAGEDIEEVGSDGWFMKVQKANKGVERWKTGSTNLTGYGTRTVH